MDSIVATASEPVVVEATKPVVQKQESSIVSKQGGDMPLEIYEAENHSPYIEKALDVDGLLPQALVDSIGTIDKYIVGLMNEKGYNPTTEAYRATLDSVKKELGIDKNTSLETTVERLSKYIEAASILRELKTLDEEKILKMLKKSPTQDLMALVMKQVAKKL